MALKRIQKVNQCFVCISANKPVVTVNEDGLRDGYCSVIAW